MCRRASRRVCVILLLLCVVAEQIATFVGGFQGSSSSSSSSSSLSSEILKQDLLSLIPVRPFRAPATNVTTDEETVRRIRDAASNLELLTPFPPLDVSDEAVAALNGDWRLVWTDASEITRLVRLPLGFRLGPVYQCVDVEDGRFENQALVKHATRLVSGHTRVRAEFALPATRGGLNRAGVPNTGDRVDVRFRQVLFTLRRFLFVPTFGKIRKSAVPRGPAEKEGVVPCIDVTYLDDSVRLSRGGDGSLFVLVRADDGGGAMTMLPKDESFFVNNDDDYDASRDVLPVKKNRISA